MMKILALLKELLQKGNWLIPVPVYSRVITNVANPVPFTINNDPVFAGSFLFAVDSRESGVGSSESGVGSSESTEKNPSSQNEKKELPNVNDELAIENNEQKRKDIPRWLVNDDLAAFTAVTGYVLRVTSYVLSVMSYFNATTRNPQPITPNLYQQLRVTSYVLNVMSYFNTTTRNPQLITLNLHHQYCNKAQLARRP